METFDSSIIAGEVDGLVDDILAVVREAELTPLAVAGFAVRAVEDNDPVRHVVWSLVQARYLDTPNIT